MKKITVFAVIALLICGILEKRGSFFSAFFSPQISKATQVQDGDSLLAKAFSQKLSDIQIQGRGKVVKILPDDRKGRKHQRFILRLGSGQTVLIAHNIDLAPRISSLSVGDIVGFYGEYEWNSKGGVLHWTHHDPQSRHTDGWLEHNNRRYQ